MILDIDIPEFAVSHVSVSIIRTHSTGFPMIGDIVVVVIDNSDR